MSSGHEADTRGLLMVLSFSDPGNHNKARGEARVKSVTFSKLILRCYNISRRGSRRNTRGWLVGGKFRREDGKGKCYARQLPRYERKAFDIIYM